MPHLHHYQLTDADKEDLLAQKHGAHGNYDGCTPSRKTTDIIFLLAIVALWAIMTILGANSTKYGNPYRLLDPINDLGQVCGQTAAVESSSYFYSVLTNGVGVCVDSCPSTNIPFNSTNPSDYYCLDYILSVPGLDLQSYIASTCFSGNPLQFQIQSNCGCMLKLSSSSVYNRCILSNSAYRNQFGTQAFKNFLISFFSDMIQAQDVIFGYGFSIALVASFLWMYILRSQCLLTVVVWSAIQLIWLIFVYLFYLSYITVVEWRNENPPVHSQQETQSLEAIMAVLMCVSVLWAVGMCCMRKAIQLAIKVISLTAECIDDMPLIVFTPLIQVIGMILFLVPWVIYGLFIASNGSLVQNTYTSSSLPVVTYTYTTYQLNQQSQNQLIYLIFSFLWTMEFILAMGSLVIAIAVAGWYFSRPEERSTKGNSFLCSAYYAAIRYHVGTAAFGSLIVAVVEFFRYAILYVEKQTGKYKNNVVVRYTLGCVTCCLWCIEKFLRFVSKNAYIQTAIHGSTFCHAAKEAFFLISRNILRIGALHIVSDIVLSIGRLLVVAISGGATFLIFTKYYNSSVNGIAAPTVIVIIIAWIVASLFIDVFRSAVDCMLQCYITDEEFHSGQPMYATPATHSFIHENSLTQEEFDTCNPRVASKNDDSAISASSYNAPSYT